MIMWASDFLQDVVHIFSDVCFSPCAQVTSIFTVMSIKE